MGCVLVDFVLYICYDDALESPTQTSQPKMESSFRNSIQHLHQGAIGHEERPQDFQLKRCTVHVWW